MKNCLFSIIFILVGITATSQNKLQKQQQQIVDEGKKLYASEMASWYGTDLFIEKYYNKDRIGGYFSYVNDPKKATCVFYSKDKIPKILGTMVFDETYDVKTSDFNLLEREMTLEEKDYYTLRIKTQELLLKDTIFKIYKDLTLNIVPLINKNEKKVYIFSAYSGTEKMVAYGNDYLITFDKNSNVKDVRKLHASYLPFEYGDADPEKKSVAGMHSHVDLSGDLISPTDICTTMLYQKFTNWETYYVISKKFVSIWNCKKNELLVMKRKAWDRIGKETK